MVMARTRTHVCRNTYDAANTGEHLHDPRDATTEADSGDGKGEAMMHLYAPPRPLFRSPKIRRKPTINSWYAAAPRDFDILGVRQRRRYYLKTMCKRLPLSS